MTTPPHTPGSLAEWLEKKQTLEGDVQSLGHLRDQLALALVTMEQNTDRVTAWLKDNREAIIVTRQQLMRAITGKKKAQLNKITAGSADGKYSKDIIGFLLSDGDMLASAVAAFGADSAEVAALAAIPAGVPDQLIEALPALGISEEIADNIDRMQKLQATDAPAPAQTAKPAEKAKGGVLSGWFKSQTQRDTEDAEAAYQGMLTHWRQIQRDLIGLQSDRHYYIDSFMDWVGENLSPSTPDQNFAAIMTQYRHPSYVIARAQEDYDQALKVRTRALLDDATTYSNVAQLLDSQNIAAFINELPVLFPRPDQSAAAEMRRLLLADFEASSFADIALYHAVDPAARLALFEAAIAFEGRLKIKGKTDPEAIYSTILDAVTAAKAPLPVKALTATLRSLSARDSDLNLRGISLRLNAVGALQQRFGDDDAAYQDALKALLSGFGSGVNTDCASHFVALRRAALDKDASALAGVMAAISQPHMGADVRALWDIAMRGESNTGISLTGMIEAAAAGKPQTRIALLSQALSLGLAREITLEGLSSTRDDSAFIAVGNIILSLLEKGTIATIGPAAITMLLAGSRIATNAEAAGKWHTLLAGKDGLVAKIAGEDTISDTQKLGFIAALLEPVATTYAKAALLENAAASLNNNKKTADLLRDAARGLVGDIYPAGENAYLANAQNIANMWYDASNSTMYFTLGGKTQVFGNRIDAKTAENLLDILHHRLGFMRESMGLFNPDLADGFEHTADSTRIIWDMHEAPLNIDYITRDVLKKRADMVHATTTDANGKTTYSSMQPRALLALIPMPAAGQWLMVDRNGNHKIVDTLNMPAFELPLVRMGNAYVNPDRASLISVDEDSRTINLRVENPVFTQLVEGMARENGLSPFASADGQYIKVSASDKTQWETCMCKVDNNPAMLSAKGDLAHLRFNLDTLGFITAYAEAKSAGIQYSHRNKGGVSGRIEVDADMAADLPKIVESLAKSAQRSDKMLVVPAEGMLSDLIVHTDHLHNVFYSAKQDALIMVGEHSDLRPPVARAKAVTALKHIAKQKGWERIDSNETDAGMDLARTDRATMMYWDKDDNSANALIGNRVVSLGMSYSHFTTVMAARIAKIAPPATAGLDAVQLKQFSGMCAHSRITAKDLPAPRASAHPRDLFAQITTARAGATSPKKVHIDDLYEEVVKSKRNKGGGHIWRM